MSASDAEHLLGVRWCLFSVTEARRGVGAEAQGGGSCPCWLSPDAQLEPRGYLHPSCLGSSGSCSHTGHWSPSPTPLQSIPGTSGPETRDINQRGLTRGLGLYLMGSPEGEET